MIRFVDSTPNDGCVPDGTYCGGLLEELCSLIEKREKGTQGRYFPRRRTEKNECIWGHNWYNSDVLEEYRNEYTYRVGTPLIKVFNDMLLMADAYPVDSKPIVSLRPYNKNNYAIVIEGESYEYDYLGESEDPDDDWDISGEFKEEIMVMKTSHQGYFTPECDDPDPLLVPKSLVAMVILKATPDQIWRNI